MRHKQLASASRTIHKAPRLLGGERRGFALQTSAKEGKGEGKGEGKAMRPTAVRARKALFDALTHRASLRVNFTAEENSCGENSFWLLDAFAGSGALGLEALSRWQRSNKGDNEGCGIFFEGDAATARVLRDNIERSGLGGRVVCRDASAPGEAREQGAIRLAFFDPPYAMSDEEVARAPAAFAKGGWFGEGALVVFQRAAGGESSLSLGEEFVLQGDLLSSSARFFFFRYRGRGGRVSDRL